MVWGVQAGPPDGVGWGMNGAANREPSLLYTYTLLPVGNCLAGLPFSYTDFLYTVASERRAAVKMVLAVAGSGPKKEAIVEEAPEFEKVSWYKDPGLRKLYFYAFVLCIASATTGYDGSFLNAVQVFPQWQNYFGHPEGSELGLLVALYQIGSVVSIPLAPIFCDNFGRKVPIIIGCVIMIAGAIIQATASTIGAFMGGRVLMGFGNSLAQIASPMLLTEIAHPQHRGRLTAVYNTLWNAGAIIVSVLSLGTNYIDSTWAWRIPALGQGLPSVIQIIFIWWVPESPRYLMAKDKHEKALDILARYHGNGNPNHPTVQFEYREIKETIKLEMEAQSNSSYLDFFKTKGNRYRLMVLFSLGLFSQWSGNAIISNYSNKLYEQAGIMGSEQNFKPALLLSPSSSPSPWPRSSTDSADDPYS
ncbi:hypothetical protein O1611_g8202 [Lasiodiplodia mahajangana]|uniref:Uncharacterized protein n=1 Tax=Lasiodiplodia mahajangana TaxID=1108764 RepID=A0ACC2JD37_9PEZI|nr:hypothetical protein O1611_g8202 [Lasiodiplodia mahajangana]